MAHPYTNYLSKIRSSESGGNDKARNPHGASGRYQFLPSTWTNMGYNVKDIYNPQLQEEAAYKLTKQNADFLKRKLGIQPTDADLYGSHFLGAYGYTKLYKAQDSAPISTVMSNIEIAHNPFLKGKTVGYLKNWLSKKMGQPAVNYGDSSPDSDSGPDFLPAKFDYNDLQFMMYDNYNALTPEQRAEFNRYTSSAESESTEDVEAVEAKNELAQKENEKNFLDELNSQYQEAQQQEVAPQQQQAPVDNSVYRMPQIELPQYQAPEMPEFQTGGSIDMEDQIEAAIEQGVDPQQIAEQLIQLGLSEEETVQMIQSVMEDMPKSYSKMKMGGEYVEFENGGLGKKVRAQKRKAYRKASEMGLIDPNTSVEKTLMDRMGVRNFQKNAVNNAYEMGISGNHNGGLDAIRHASSAAKVASTMPFGVGFVAANALGAAHEADSKMNWRETASDMYNNFAGSLVGSIPFIDDSTRQNIIIEAQKRGILHNVNQKAPQRREDGGGYYQEGGPYIVTGDSPIIIPTQGSYPLSYRDRGDRDTDGVLFTQAKKVSRVDENGKPLTRNQIAYNQDLWNDQKEAYGPAQQDFNIWKNNEQNTLQGGYNPQEYYDMVAKLNSRPDVQSYETNGPDFSSTSCPISKAAAKQEKKDWKKRENGGYFTNKDKKTFSDLKNTYPTDKLVDILTYMSNGGTYGVPSYQEGGPEEVVTPNQNIGLVSIQNPDGSISKIRTDSQEYMDLYKSGNLQRGLASENADRETWFDGQLDEVTVVAPPRKKLEGNINLIGSGSTTTSVPEEAETVRDNIVDIQPTLQQKVEKDVAYDKFADKREAKDILEGEKQVKEELSGKIKLEDTLTNQDIDISKYKTKADVMKLQQFLDSKGYNLNPLNKFENAGIDGKLGKVTFGAVTEYNKHLATSGYESIKEGEGLLGKCTEKQCTEYTENEIFRNLQPEIPRQEWNKLTGLYGDTWKIGSNIIKAGGKEVKNQGISPGDVITIYTGGVSPYQDQANKEGTGDTHSALVDKVNPDGSYYVLHNLHKGSKEKGFEGREYRDLVRGNQIQGHDATLTVRHVYRPNYGKVKLGEKKIVREDLAINVDPKKASTLSTGEYNNFFTSASAKDKLENLFIKPLNDSKNKKVIAKVFGLGDDEYNSLAKSALGVLGQETEYGTNPKYTTGAKKTAANIAKLVGAKNDEVSYGAGQLKYETNFGSDALTELGINQDNFNSEDKASLTTMYKLATDYKGFLKRGYNKKDALYRAITVYNTSLGHVSGGKKVEDWAKEYNVDYTNKVLNFSNMFNVNDNKNSYKTTLDDLLLQKNVAKWNPRLKKLKKI